MEEREGKRMSTKFTATTDSRVEGLSFHRKRRWILVSLHSGVIELWDYEIHVLVHRYGCGEHHGPVRAVHFHNSRPLFASGGDDCNIKIWSYESHRCLFTLLGHLDHIRTVQFHHEFSWIISASDDWTIRIWNWRSRTCISVLSGHGGPVTSAFFHPKEDLLLSASMDKTIRIWDIGSLIKRTVTHPSGDSLQLGQVETYSSGAVVIHTGTGHDQGVNWAAFHPSLPLIVSGANDRKVKSWRMKGPRIKDAKDWEVKTMWGHENNVSCVLFQSRKEDTIVSSSEDKTVRVWDAKKKVCLWSFSKDHESIWILAYHQEMNYLAAGHDSGIHVFKWDKERPAFSVSGVCLLYLKDQFLHVFNYSTRNDIQLIQIRRPCSNNLYKGHLLLSYSHTANAALISSDMDGDSYELYVVPAGSNANGHDIPEAKGGIGRSAVFVDGNMFAVLEKNSNQVFVRNLENQIVTKSVLPVAADAIFYAGPGALLCRAQEKLFIVDLQRWIVLWELQISFVKHIVWSHDLETVALLQKHSIILADKKLVATCILNETIAVKGGAWDEDGVFIYSTLTHIKYCLPNGESGIIKTLDVPIYITRICGNTIFCFDREGRILPIIIDSTEYIFKLSVLRKRHDQIMGIIRNSDFCGKAMIAYLLQKGFPEFALHLVKDKRTCFNLAIESGNIEIAVDFAKEIGDIDDWFKLGEVALHGGNTDIAEYAYQCAKNIRKLSFLYLITGKLDKLYKMMRIAEVKNDVMSQFHNALCLGDIKERVRILASAGHLPLAYITASVHGLHDVAQGLAVQLGDNIPSLQKSKSASLLIPPKPILCGGNWPLLLIPRGRVDFEAGLDNVGWNVIEDYDAEQNRLRFRKSKCGN